jgi:hypothetical protein
MSEMNGTEGSSEAGGADAALKKFIYEQEKNQKKTQNGE